MKSDSKQEDIYMSLNSTSMENTQEDEDEFNCSIEENIDDLNEKIPNFKSKPDIVKN